MDQVRMRGGLSLIVAGTAFAMGISGCKKESPRPIGATQQELNREVVGTAREHESTQFHFLGVPEANNAQQDNSTAEPQGIGGGPRDDSTQPPMGDPKDDTK